MKTFQPASLSPLASNTASIYQQPSPPSLSTPPSTTHAKTSDAVLSSDKRSPRTFFRAAIGQNKEKQVERLVRAVQSFATAVDRPSSFYENFWSVYLPTNPAMEPTSDPSRKDLKEVSADEVRNRLLRLKAVRQIAKHGVAGRLCRIFFAHEVDYISQWNDLDTSGRGVGRLSAAMNTVARLSSVALKDVQYDLKKSRNIMQVLEEGGPSSVVEIGDRDFDL